ncbi:DUF3298 domain-containing protein [Sporosarcina siberiensis]|uniref:DUF3298 domain-containing protein n=1 Tax=Sporosarcina siberiensis TaxID=1365606 RepID=A0ABW4SEH0_9BACL
MKKMDKLIKKYDTIDIPSELEYIVKNSIRRTKAVQTKRPLLKQWSIGVVAAAALFISSINMSPAMAQSMVNIPLLGAIVEVFTVQKLALDEKTYQANLAIPEINGLENEELQNLLNNKYIEEDKASFKEFEDDVDEMKHAGDGHLGIDTGYDVMTDTARILSIARYKVNTMGSSSINVKYDTIDKQESILLTLPILFKDDQYIEVISSYIAGEMKRQLVANKEVSYFFDDPFTGSFENIKPYQNFYITSNHKLVISFDKYEVASGSMGVVTFEIPSDILSDLLVSDTYIN